MSEAEGAAEMRVRFHVFSGTGNTLHAARHLGRLLEDCGHAAEILEIDSWIAPPGDRADLEVIMFPVYATGVPQVMQAYLRKFPRSAGGRAAVVSTNGRISLKWRDGYEGQALLQAWRMLLRRGYDVFLADTLDYPHNVTNVIPPSREERREAIIALAMTRLPAVAMKMARGEKSIKQCGLFNQAWTWVFNFLYIHFGRRVMGKFFIADAKCNACGACVRACPVGAIRMAGGRPRWKWSCQGCERCINLCPRRAIQNSLPRMLALIAVPFLFKPAVLLRGLIPGSFFAALGRFGGAVLNLILGVLAYVISIYLLDKAFFLAQLIPGLRKIFDLSHTSSFRRYLAPGFRPTERRIKTG